MDSETMERERELIEEVEHLMPAFAEVCRNKQTAFIAIHQDRFAVQLRDEDIFLFGKAIKYAGIAGKEVQP